MVTFTWDSTYEGMPGSTLSRAMIDNELRKVRSGVREIMEIEHNWGPYTNEDDGSHIPGETTVMLKGNATTRDALTNVQEGALYFLSDGGTIELYVYTSSAWVKATDVDHGSYSNLLSDSHPEYVLKGLDETMTEALDMGGNDVINASPPSAGYDSYLVYGNHESLPHLPLGNNDAIKDDAIKHRHLKLQQYSFSGTLDAGEDVSMLISNLRFMFFPNFYAANGDIRIQSDGVSGLYFGFALQNIGESDGIAYRVNFEVLIS